MEAIKAVKFYLGIQKELQQLLIVKNHEEPKVAMILVRVQL